MRDFFYSEIATIQGMKNLPDDLDLAIAAGRKLCAIVVTWLVDRLDRGMTWTAMAWWIHDHLPCSDLQFFPKLAAFNIGWHEAPKRTIYSFVEPRGFVTKPGFANHDGSHADSYAGFPELAVANHILGRSPA